MTVGFLEESDEPPQMKRRLLGSRPRAHPDHCQFEVSPYPLREAIGDPERSGFGRISFREVNLSR